MLNDDICVLLTLGREYMDDICNVDLSPNSMIDIGGSSLIKAIQFWIAKHIKPSIYDQRMSCSRKKDLTLTNYLSINIYMCVYISDEMIVRRIIQSTRVL